MKARELMTTDVVTVTPDTPRHEVARLLLSHGISAVPVVDGSGTPVGMVSEGDLIGRDDDAREARRDWWLAMLAEGEALNPDYLAHLREQDMKVQRLMAAPVVTVSEDAEAAEIAHLLATYRIKRVPVLRDGRLVGIVSRADLLRAMNALPPTPAPRRPIIFTLLHRDASAETKTLPPPDKSLTEISADAFRELAGGFKHLKVDHEREKRRAAIEKHRQAVKALIDHHIEDSDWRALLHGAREAAEHGEKEFLLFRFPSDLCSDHGRAINNTLPGWPATLRGEAAEIYLRWEHELRPHGFHLSAKVLEFPGGFPGDIGFFLVWGE
jgi:CBS domain-containing protein